MKKIIVLLLLLSILLCACFNSYRIKVGESMNKINNRYRPVIDLNALRVYKLSENYLIMIIDEKGIIEKLVEFSPERRCCQTQGVDLIKLEDIKQFAALNFNQVKEMIGQPHVDIGSGLYSPAYLTEDAYLICFSVDEDEGVISEVFKYDLQTGKLVERTYVAVD